MRNRKQKSEKRERERKGLKAKILRWETFNSHGKIFLANNGKVQSFPGTETLPTSVEAESNFGSFRLVRGLRTLWRWGGKTKLPFFFLYLFIFSYLEFFVYLISRLSFLFHIFFQVLRYLPLLLNVFQRFFSNFFQFCVDFTSTFKQYPFNHYTWPPFLIFF